MTSDNEKGQTRGQKTKAALLNGVLDLVEQGLAFSAMSLREVTRQAGVVPDHPTSLSMYSSSSSHVITPGVESGSTKSGHEHFG